MEEVTNPVLPLANRESESEPAKNPEGTHSYNPWYSPEATRERDEERKRLVNNVSETGIRRRFLLWVATRLGHKPKDEGAKLTLMQGGGSESNISSHRIITGPQGLKKTSGDVARSRIEGQEIPDNMLEHPRRYPGASQPPPIDAA